MGLQILMTIKCFMFQFATRTSWVTKLVTKLSFKSSAWLLITLFDLSSEVQLDKDKHLVLGTCSFMTELHDCRKGNTLCILGEKFSRQQFEIFSYFSQKIGFDIFHANCLLSIINLLSTELARRVAI